MQENKTGVAGRYHKLKASGRCPVCGGERDNPQRVYCIECLRYARAKRYAVMAAETPEECAARKAMRRVKEEERRERYRAEGRCIRCGKQAMLGYTLCLQCSTDVKRRNNERYARKKQERLANGGAP